MSPSIDITRGVTYPILVGDTVSGHGGGLVGFRCKPLTTAEE